MRKPSNLLTKPSVLIMYLAIIPLVHSALDDLITNHRVSPTKLSEIVFVGTTALLQSVLRYSEDGDEPLYTPKYLPGKNKDDFIDFDLDGIDDRF